MKKIPVIILSVLTLLFMQSTDGHAANDIQINYNITFPEAQVHYVDVEMFISGLDQNTLVLKMPVWTPGSYLIREFEKNIEGFNASAKGELLAFKKTRKNWWNINTQGRSAIVVKYRVYCNEISVRTSEVDASHAFLSGTGIFMYPADMLHVPSTIHITPYKQWNKISTGLDMVDNDPFTRKAPDYDVLYDSPIEIGNQDIFNFKAAGVDYEVCMYDGGNYDREKLKVDMAKIVEQETSIYGENPNKHYVFIVHNRLVGGGGLEHLNSTVLAPVRDKYNTPTGYQNFLTLVAHEHFHLWNVKRLRPMALGPFDYDNENYTTDLWIAEGFTAYYEDITLQHAGIIDTANYLGLLNNEINTLENAPGRKYQSVADASFDAWIKAYRPNENSANTSISYYTKGCVLAMLLNLEIINDSHAKHSLDDVMKYMYNKYYKDLKRGYTDAEFKEGLEKFAGKNLDDFYASYVTGVDDVDYAKYLGYAGYKLTDGLAGNNDPFLGVNTNVVNGKIMVTSIVRNSSAWISGINTDDQITAINGTPVANLQDALSGKKVNDKIMVTVLRDGISTDLPVTLLHYPRFRYKIETVANPTETQLTVRNKWLKL